MHQSIGLGAFFSESIVKMGDQVIGFMRPK
jgi:hypothetical protein